MIIDLLKNRVELGLKYLVEVMVKELQQQGHEASGRTKESFRVEVYHNGNNITGEILSAAHTQYLNRGTKPHRPPFQAIYDWSRFVKPGISDKERKRFTWAVIGAIAKEGTPTARSYIFSKNARRTEFVKEAVNQGKGRFYQIIDLYAFALQLAEEKLVAA